jgi:hypothetical protein
LNSTNQFLFLLFQGYQAISLVEALNGPSGNDSSISALPVLTLAASGTAAGGDNAARPSTSTAAGKKGSRSKRRGSQVAILFLF